MLKEFFLRQMLKRQLKGVPEEEQEKLISIVTQHPELFQKIALEVQDKVKGGQDQMAAMMEVMQKHQAELKQILDKNT